MHSAVVATENVGSSSSASRLELLPYLLDQSNPAELSSLMFEVDVNKAEAYNLSDRKKILSLIQETFGAASFNATLKRAFADAVAMMVNRYDHGSPSWLHMANVAALVLKDGGHFKPADELLTEAAGIAEKVEGSGSTNYAIVKNNQGLLFHSQGLLENAEQCFRDALRIKLACQVPSSSLATTKDGLALVLKDKGQLADAEGLSREALMLRRANLHGDSRELALSLNNLGLVLTSLRRFAEAEELYCEAVEIHENQAISHHPQGLAVKCNLALLLSEQRRYQEAEHMLHNCLNTAQVILGPSHPQSAMILQNLGNVYLRQKNFGEAQRYSSESLSILRSCYSFKHHKTTPALINLGLAQQHQGQYEEAENNLQLCLDICRQELGMAHELATTAVNALAGLYRSQRRLADAEPLLREALQAQQACTSTSVAAKHVLIINNLASVVRGLGNNEEAETLYRQAIGCISDMRRDKDVLIMEAAVLAGLGRVLGNLFRVSEGEDMLRQALATLESNLGHNHPQTESVRKALTALQETSTAEAQTPIKPSEDRAYRIDENSIHAD